ncbi:hypothetical protein [Candidatus Regiella endosymbiont of Tuberolachnus salignus]|uniref:hypothetical protein n=1 Tax=Candidatus Regiella endosymbiont of Tuberolachnus salignus TaxID=3077956 RepID=UPI0030CC319D
MNQVAQCYNINVNLVNDTHFHHYGSQKKVTDKFTNMYTHFNELYSEVEDAKQYITIVKNKILSEYREIYDDQSRVILVPKMLNVGTLQHSDVRKYFCNLLRTKDELIIHETMNRFYFYVTRIEDYFNRYSDRIVFISSQNRSFCSII